jgi:hypothetical protein
LLGNGVPTVALAFADELLADPDLLHAYAHAVGPDDEALLVVYAPDFGEAELAARLSPLVEAAGLGDDDPREVIALAVPRDEELEARLAAGSGALLSRRVVGGAFEALPRVEADRTGPPDFIGVAAQKCGTTWWFELIARHPQVRRPQMGHFKEARLFVERPVPGSEDALVAAYHGFFPRSAGEVTGEWTPDYLWYSWSLDLLHAAAPEARLLAMVRDPIERYRSGIVHMLRYDLPITHASLRASYRAGLYARQLKRVLERYPRERLLVLQYEECCREPLPQLRRTYEFLGLDPGFVPPNPREVVHGTDLEKIELPPRFLVRLVDRYRRDAVELARLFPAEIDLSLWTSLWP